MSVKLLRGDCRHILKTLPDCSVHACITSPPYWGLRSYLPAGHPDKPAEIGSEPTVQEWVAVMVDVFREVRRVLRDDGTLWVNLGDSYAGSWGAQSREHAGKHAPNVSALSANQVKAAQIRDSGTGNLGRTPGLKPKDLIGQPWRVAFALQADGWWLRQEIIWAKRNPMPESIRDRFTKAHEHVFLLSKSERYYFDFDAVQEEASEGTHARLPGNVSHKHTAAYEAGDEKARTKAGLVAYAERQRAQYKTPDGWDTRTGAGGHGSFRAEGREKGHKPPHNSAASRKARANEASKSAPTELHNGMRAPTPKAALASSGNDGAYSDGKSERMGRGAGWRNKNNASFDEAMAVMPQTRNPRSVRWLASEPFRGAHFATYPSELIRPFVLAGCPPGGVVLDPFGGSGTTGLVADQEGRSAILIDIDERNVPMARERITSDAPLFAEVAA